LECSSTAEQHRDKKMKNGDYILVIAPDWFKGKRYRGRYCYEHHLVWEKETGCPVPDGCIIHHKDGNKYNNTISNLQLMDAKAHISLHGQQKTKKIAIIKCPSCGKIFEKDARLLNFRTLVFCSRQCIGKYGYNTKHNEELRKKVEESKKTNIIKIINK